MLFERLEMRDPAHIAVKYYKQYRSGSAKTLKSIQITLASHMEKFNLDSLIALTATDELHLQDMGEKRVALFALIPDSDTSFNFLVSILYQQLFQQLFDSADHKHGGSLPVPVHFLMDEFANISLPNDFEIKLSTMRSRNVFVSIILQNILRTFVSESLAALMPFRVQEIMEPGGIYYGENAISGNLLLCNRANLLNQSTIITGVPGSGKSFSAKELITFLALATQDDILVCDPEREYYALGQALGGEVIRIAAGSPDHINAMDMVEGYGDGGNPVVDKSEFILSLFEQLDRGGIGPLQKSIIDRCVDAVYAAYKRGGPVPTLCVLREKLLEQPEEEARDLALALELFTTGSLDAFAHETNVDTQNRIVIYDIMDLGRQLKTMGLLIITDAMLNRVTENWRKGKRTHLFIDEFHVVFQNPYSADFFDSAWRRFRKRGAYPTAITQNVEYLLDSVQASTMLSNSEMLILLNQAPSDREKLAALLNISPEQTSYITNAPAGCGLLRYGGALVPFKNQFPKDTELYRLMTTKPDESIIVGGKTK